MTVKNFTTQELNLPFTDTFKTLCHVWDRQQAISAKSAIRKQDRLKTKLTVREKLIKFTQIGGKLIYKDISYTTENGMGILQLPNGKGEINATLSDFSKACNTYYGKVWKSF
jgi:hypothetical protein